MMSDEIFYFKILYSLMNSDIIAIGDPDTIKKIIGGCVYAEHENVFVIAASSVRRSSIITNLISNSINAYTYQNYEKIKAANPKYVPLRQIDTERVYDWLSTGAEEFGVLNSNVFELYSVTHQGVSMSNEIEPVASVFLSNTGAMTAFVSGPSVSVHVNSDFQRLFENKFDSNPTDLQFAQDDMFLAVASENKLYIYDIMRNEEIMCRKLQNCMITERGVILEEEKEEYEILNGRAAKIDNGYITARTKKIKVERSKRAYFIDDKLQQIVFDDGECITKKNHTNIKDVEFYFSESKLYVMITKLINDAEQYNIEVYCRGDIAIKKFEVRPVEISVTDERMVVYDMHNVLRFYTKERYAYAETKNVRMEGRVIASCKGDITCIYDDGTGNIEFYDGDKIRAVYAHNRCTCLRWSPSGMYLVAASLSDYSGGLIQVFTCDCKLLFKRDFSNPQKLVWREYAACTEEERESVKDMPLEELDYSMYNKEDDIEALLSDWKMYLLSKKNEL